MVCPDYRNPKLKFQGSKEASRYKQDERYGIISILRCSESCEKPHKINEWLSQKSANVLYIKKTVNFKDPVRYVAMIAGYGVGIKLYREFTDIGYRYYRNEYNTQNYWYWPFTNTSSFFSLREWSITTFNVAEKDLEKNPVIAEVWIRLDTKVV